MIELRRNAICEKIYMYIYIRNGKLCVQNDPIKCENSEEFQVEFI